MSIPRYPGTCRICSPLRLTTTITPTQMTPELAELCERCTTLIFDNTSYVSQNGYTTKAQLSHSNQKCANCRILSDCIRQIVRNVQQTLDQDKASQLAVTVEECVVDLHVVPPADVVPYVFQETTGEDVQYTYIRARPRVVPTISMCIYITYGLCKSTCEPHRTSHVM